VASSVLPPTTMHRSLLVGLLVVACGQSAPKPASWTIYSTAQKDDPPGGVRITATVPGDWETEADAMGSPSFKHAQSGPLGLAAIVLFPCREPNDKDEKACVDKVVSYEFDKDDLARSKTSEIGGHRWIEATNPANGRVHARLFIPVTAARAVVMCVAMMVEPKDLPAVRAFCETVKVGG